jgi:hypothetical protein
MEKQKILTIRFKNVIAQDEISLFRGAIIHTMENANILFHNHEEGKYRYAYPLIQYKRIHKYAAIVCIGEGTEAIGAFFSSCNFDINIGNKQMKLEIDSVKAYQVITQIWDSQFSYRINKWLPLNQENYERYTSIEILAEKYAMLEKILVGNILSFAKGIGIRLEQQVVCKITDISDQYILKYKNVDMTAINARFKCNFSIPDYIGLGKGVSLGFGTVTRNDNTNN